MTAAVDPNASSRSSRAPLLNRLRSSTAALTEADVLNRLHAPPDTALFTATESAIYLNTRRDLLRTWRWKGGGPRFLGNGHLIRYRKGDLDSFLAGSAA
jgi:hypothetical protein